MKKKIIAIVLAVILVAAVAVAAVISNKNKTDVNTDGSLYDYNVQKSGKGYTVTVSGDFGVGKWLCTSDGSVKCEQKDASAKKAAFGVESTGEGNGLAKLVLTDENDLLNSESYEITLSFNTDAKGGLSFENSSHTELPAAVYSPDGAECAYAYKSNRDGSVLFAINDSGYSGLVNEAALVEVNGTSGSGEGKLVLDVSPVAAGSDVLKFFNAEKGRAIAVSIEVTEDNAVSIKNVDFEDYKAAEAEEKKPEKIASDSAKAAASELKIPAGYQLAETDAIIISYAEGEKTGECLCAVMKNDKDTVYYYRAADIPVADFTAYVCSEIESGEDTAVGSANGRVYAEKLGYTVVWGNAGGDSFACICENKDTAVKCAAELYELNPAVSY